MEEKKRIRAEDHDEDRAYRFHVLLPNGISVPILTRNAVGEAPLKMFLERVKEKSLRILKETEPSNPKHRRKILWDSEELHLEDALGNKIKGKLCLDNFKPNKIHYMRLFDGADENADTFENMWDLTPDTDLLAEIPDDYTFETALADLIDNSLQAVWSNGEGEWKLISVEVKDDRVSIFDTGPGMDGGEENSIVKWGKVGASLHRSSKRLAIGGKPPYLTPYFGMFGYGGTYAAMHLGRHAIVSAKTKKSRKVYWLRLEREALLRRSGYSLNPNWKVEGGIRDPLVDEIEKSPHGSFTKVDMEPKLRLPDIFKLRCKLKDIYFPYIQCDEMSKEGKTIRPVEFEVNGMTLTEVDGGEFAITNLHSCNGPDFILNLHLSIEEDGTIARAPAIKKPREANAQLKCVYFPIHKGKENIERILDKLKADGYGIKEDFETFSRISIRRLGRLLPDARWAPLPFMKSKQKGGDRVQILKRCCLRVKCFIDTDAGFHPMSSKTDLQIHDPFTKTLKDLGSNPAQKDKGVKVDIYRGGKQLTFAQLQKAYQDWVLHMHTTYDEEVNCGDDVPVWLLNASNKEALGIKSNAARVHRVISRKGITWSSGQKVKILKGACPGCHSRNMYATLEYFLLEGCEGNAGDPENLSDPFEHPVTGEGRVICRPMGVPDEDGCVLMVGANGAQLELHGSKSLPIIVADPEKCVAVGMDDWNCQAEKLNQKVPSTIEILGLEQCKELGIDRALPTQDTISAGFAPPNELVAVLRPSSFTSNCTSNYLDQKYVIKDNFEMCMDIKFRAEAAKASQLEQIFSGSATHTSRRGCQGLYIFQLQCVSSLFQKAGIYSFSFSIRNSTHTSCERNVHVKALSKIKYWELSKEDQLMPLTVSVGACFPPFSVVRYDVYDNCIPFECTPEILFQLKSTDHVLSYINKVKLEVSSDQFHVVVRNLRIITNSLDKVRPSYEAALALSQPDKQLILSIPCQVVPGPLHSVTLVQSQSANSLLPKQVLQDIKLEMFDRHGNHVKEGTEVQLRVHGFLLLDQDGRKCKVDHLGFVDLSGLLKVTGGYGTPVSLSVLSAKQVIYTKKFLVDKRELRMATNVPELCWTQSKLKDITFEVVDSKGDVDQTIHDDDKIGEPHILKLRTDMPDFDDSLRYAFRLGHCVIPSITFPRSEGSYVIEAFHSRHPELHLKFKVNVARQSDMEGDILSDFQAFEAQNDCRSQSTDEQIASCPVSLTKENVATFARPQSIQYGHNMHRIQSTDEQIDPHPTFLTTKNVATPARPLSKQCGLNDRHGSCLSQYPQKNTIFSTPRASKHLITSVGSDFQQTPARTPSKRYGPSDRHGTRLLQSPVDNTMFSTPGIPKDLISLVGPDFQVVEKELDDYSLLLKDHEDDLAWLSDHRDKIVKDLLKLQDSAELLQLDQHVSMSEKEVVLEAIQSKVNTAAAVCSLVPRNVSLHKQHDKFISNMVGVVALLGSAPTRALSCLLADYLGEDQMTAIVFQSSTAVTPPEEYEHELSSVAADLEKYIAGSPLIICLEDIRPYTGSVVEDDPQRRLALRDPTLPNGKTLPGFLGYAVNIIDVDVDHLQTKTITGHGLRETLFYRLFGELQLYETKELMKQAHGCITGGAVSLDGGFIYGNGMVLLGRKKADVRFPVTAPGSELVVIAQGADIMQLIEDKKEELRTASETIAYVGNLWRECKKRIEERKALLIKEKEALLKVISSQQSLNLKVSSVPSQITCD